jgi:hypothetical protein
MSGKTMYADKPPLSIGERESVQYAISSTVEGSCPFPATRLRHYALL